jgi:hypothetical protein
MKHPHRSEAWMVLDELEREFRRVAVDTNEDFCIWVTWAANKVRARKSVITRRENRRRKLEDR